MERIALSKIIISAKLVITVIVKKSKRKWNRITLLTLVIISEVNKRLVTWLTLDKDLKTMEKGQKDLLTIKEDFIRTHLQQRKENQAIIRIKLRMISTKGCKIDKKIEDMIWEADLTKTEKIMKDI